MHCYSHNDMTNMPLHSDLPRVAERKKKKKYQQLYQCGMHAL